MHRFGLTSSVLLGIILIPAISFATLGRSESSVHRDAEAFGSKATQAKQSDNYKVYEFNTNGGVVRECVSADGKVFAMSWRNFLKRPDLSQLLGPVFPEFDANDPAKVSQKTGRITHVVKTEDFEVRAGGNQRNMRGFAVIQKYIPNPGDEVRCLQ